MDGLRLIVNDGRDMDITLHRGDLPAGLDLGGTVAVDSETMGLQPGRDRLCLVQLSAGDGTAHLVQLAAGGYAAPNLRRLLADRGRLKLFHYARFDLAVLRRYLEVECGPVYCTKIASRLARTYTDRHGLKDLVRELLGRCRCAMRPRTCFISTRCARGWTRCWSGRVAAGWRRPASISCRRGWRWIWRAGRTRMYSPIDRGAGLERRAHPRR